ncbi:MAG: NifU family protein [Bacteroidetes bacterium]|nr:NifU family protein [Bacteroidota bacterium]
METKKIPTSVYAEMTPNPMTMKFVADRILIGGGLQVEYKKSSDAKGSSPLAEELFHFPFVKSVFISSNYVTVTRDESLDWDMIVMQLREYIREWLMDHEIAVSNVPAELMSRAEKAEPIPSTQETSQNIASLPASPYDDEIVYLLNEFVRPAVEQDGGAIDFVGYDNKKVYVNMRGACSGCPSSTATLKGGIENLLKAKLPDAVEEVIAQSL